MRWVGVPFSVPDETLYSYLELFSKPVRQARNLWWEKDEPGEGLKEVWNAERTLLVNLNQGVSHVPVWHYVGGTKLKLLVPSRRSCSRCLKAVGECKGGGVWGSCEESGTARGNWKEEQEKFLKNVGSSLELQKALENDLKEVEVDPEDEEMVAQMKAEAEGMEEAAKAKELLVQRVPHAKVCGGLRLQYFPESSGNHKTEKREALLTIIELCTNLSNKEEEKLGGAGIEMFRPERGRKGTVDIKITLDQADELLQKVWSQLEVPYREEGVKRYMIEASTEMSPVKSKPKSAFQQAQRHVVTLLREEEEERKEEDEQKRRKDCGDKNGEEEEVQVLQEAVIEKPTCNNEDASNLSHPMEIIETLPEGTPQDLTVSKEKITPPEEMRSEEGGRPKGAATKKEGARNGCPPREKGGAAGTVQGVKESAKSLDLKNVTAVTSTRLKIQIVTAVATEMPAQTCKL